MTRHAPRRPRRLPLSSSLPFFSPRDGTLGGSSEAVAQPAATGVGSTAAPQSGASTWATGSRRSGSDDLGFRLRATGRQGWGEPDADAGGIPVRRPWRWWRLRRRPRLSSRGSATTAPALAHPFLPSVPLDRSSATSFVRFVSIPDVLELASTCDLQMPQLQGISKFMCREVLEMLPLVQLVGGIIMFSAWIALVLLIGVRILLGWDTCADLLSRSVVFNNYENRFAEEIPSSKKEAVFNRDGGHW